MNILLIGNGFDIAHGLPTKYTDFIEFCKKVNKLYKTITINIDAYYSDELEIWNVHNYIKEQLLCAAKSRKKRSALEGSMLGPRAFTVNDRLDELFKNTNENIWMEYFINRSNVIGENWIDFEKEISKIIKIFDKVKMHLDKHDDFPNLRRQEEKVINEIANTQNKDAYSIFRSSEDATEFANKLYYELEKLIRAFEIYISEFIEKIPVEATVNVIKELNITHLLSFNYSNIFEPIYGVSKSIDMDYIHGKANIENSIETNNMVLGIDEYLADEVKDTNVDFIEFKKYFQRIHKSTGCKYKEWIEIIEKDEDRINKLVHDGKDKLKDRRHNLYIFGHSLDTTDRDVLRDLILHKNVETTIYYHERIDEDGKGDNGRKDLAQKITNLVKVIGQEELIKRTGGKMKTIHFKLQGEEDDENGPRG